jgi:hypothetical protein
MQLGSIATSPIATLKNKDQPPPSRKTRSAEGAQCRAHSLTEMIQAVHPRGARGARSGSVATSPIATLKHFSLQLGSPKREVSKAPSITTLDIVTLECRGLPPPIRDT